MRETPSCPSLEMRTQRKWRVHFSGWVEGAGQGGLTPGGAALRAQLPPLMHEWKGALMGSAGTGALDERVWQTGSAANSRGHWLVAVWPARGVGGWGSCPVCVLFLINTHVF